jgi:hypothetical protein
LRRASPACSISCREAAAPCSASAAAGALAAAHARRRYCRRVCAVYETCRGSLRVVCRPLVLWVASGSRRVPALAGAHKPASDPPTVVCPRATRLLAGFQWREVICAYSPSTGAGGVSNDTRAMIAALGPHVQANQRNAPSVPHRRELRGHGGVHRERRCRVPGGRGGRRSDRRHGGHAARGRAQQAQPSRARRLPARAQTQRRPRHGRSRKSAGPAVLLPNGRRHALVHRCRV